MAFKKVHSNLVYIRKSVQEIDRILKTQFVKNIAAFISGFFKDLDRIVSQNQLFPDWFMRFMDRLFGVCLWLTARIGLLTISLPSFIGWMVLEGRLSMAFAMTFFFMTFYCLLLDGVRVDLLKDNNKPAT